VIVVLSKRKPAGRKDKIFLLNASRRFTKGRPKNYLADADVQELAAELRAGQPVAGEMEVITTEQAREADYNLIPSKWVSQQFDVERRPIEAVLDDLLGLDDQARELDLRLRRTGHRLMTNGNWPLRPIGDLFEIRAGFTMSSAARAGTNKVPFLRTSNVFWDRLDLGNLDEMSVPEHELPERLLKAGDLLVCEGGEIGRAAIWDGRIERITFQNHLHRLRPKRDDVVPRFYVFFLQSAFTQLGIFEGAGNKTTIPNLSRNRLAALEVPQPPLEDQQEIVSVLATVRGAMALHEQRGNLLAELFSGSLFTLMTRSGELESDDLVAVGHGVE
jgi:hypothetical protein